MIKTILSFILLFTLSLTSSAQKKVRFGVEQDVLPYIFGGYFLGGFVSYDHFRLRIIYAKVTKPDFVLEPGFTHNNIEATALVADYFLNSDQTGIWFASGLVIWNGSIQTGNNSGKAYHRDYLLSIGGGYNYFLTDHLYISPWAAVHTKIGGTKNLPVNTEFYTTPLFNPEGSVKFGWIF